MKERDYGYDVVRFAATIMICIWHFYTTCKENCIIQNYIVDSLFARGPINMGGIGVGLFFLLSGALLIRGYKEQINTIHFYKKRLLRICVPNIIGFNAALLVTYVINSDIVKSDKIGMLISAVGLNFFNLWKYIGISCVWLIGEWFTTVIIFIYLLFPLLRRLFLTHKWIGTSIIILLFLMNLKFKILSNEGGWASYSNGIMLFWIGMLFEEYKRYISTEIYPIVCLCLVFYLVFPFQFHNEYDYIFVLFFSFLIFVILYQIKWDSNIISFICKLNFEMYLVHHRIYLILVPALLTSNSSLGQIVVCFIVLFWLTVLMAEVLQHNSNMFIKHISVPWTHV